MLKSAIFLIFQLSFVLCAAPEEESCHSYAGGSVYPLGSNPQETEHKLQWTKAVSTY